MVASGIPVSRRDHCEAAIQLAIRMFQVFIRTKETYSNALSSVNLRVGIACGPVVAGIIGRSKYSYDCMANSNFESELN